MRVSHRIACVNAYTIIQHHVEYDRGQMANMWSCPLGQHPSTRTPVPPASLTPVLEDNLARTPLPTVSCLIGSPYTDPRWNCSVCTLWFKRGPWFSFVIDSVLWDERKGKQGQIVWVADFSVSCSLWTSQHVWTVAGLLRWRSRVLFLDSTESLMRICS